MKPKNHITIINELCKLNIIYQDRTYTFLFDREDLDLVLKHNWTVNPQGYAVCKKGGMHRLIMNTPERFHTHHINVDVTDNRRTNLIILTPQEHSRVHADIRRAQRREDARRREFLKKITATT